MPRIELCKYFHKIRVKGIFVRGWVGSWGWELVGVLGLGLGVGWGFGVNDGAGAGTGGFLKFWDLFWNLFGTSCN
jgi:hypothetical protein